MNKANRKKLQPQLLQKNDTSSGINYHGEVSIKVETKDVVINKTSKNSGTITLFQHLVNCLANVESTHAPSKIMLCNKNGDTITDLLTTKVSIGSISTGTDTLGGVSNNPYVQFNFIINGALFPTTYPFTINYIKLFDSTNNILASSDTTDTTITGALSNMLVYWKMYFTT